MPDGQVRGAILDGQLAWVERRHGAPARARVLAEVASTGDRALAARLETGVSVDLWYPFAAFLAVSQAIDAACGAGDATLVRTMAREAIERATPPLKRVLLKVAPPSVLVEQLATRWRQLWDSGLLEIRRSEPGRLLVELVDFASPHAVHCESVAGALEGLLKLSGSSLGVSHPSCRARGDAHCLFALEAVQPVYAPTGSS